MKKVIQLSCMSLVLCYCTGCLWTFHPLYTKSDVLQLPSFKGSYRTANQRGAEMLVIRGLDETSIKLPGKVNEIRNKGYLMVYQDENGRNLSESAAFIVKFGNNYYLDAFPLRLRTSGDALMQACSLPLHYICKINDPANGLLRISPLDQGFVHNLLENKRIRIKHEVSSSDDDATVSVITAGTKELQDFVEKYGDNVDAYDKKEEELYKKILP